jgi:flagellar export protein FliJ
MTAFQFRMATVLKLREATRDQKLAHLAEALAAEDKLRSRRMEINAELARLNGLQQGRTATGQINIDVLLSSSRYDAMLRAELATIAGHETTLAAEIQRRQHAVLAADRDVKMLEKLREKQREAYRAQESLVESKELDEIGARQSWQQAQDGESSRGFEEARR